MSPTQLVVSAAALSKRFGAQEALRDVTFSIEGGVVGLIGPNGAGKSTLLKILLGLIHPTAGRAEVLGLDVARDGLDIRKRVGVLHEKPRFPVRATGREFLTFSAGLRGIENASTEIQQAATSAGIHAALDRRIGTYSAGMVQRLGLACAVMGSPQLVILDEPTANLDPRGRSETLSRVQSLWMDRGIHVIFSTHLLSEVERVCNSVILLDSGRLLAAGKMDSVKARHPEDSTLRFRVERPEEFAALWAKRFGSDHRLVIEGGRLRVPLTPEVDTLAHVNQVARQGAFDILEIAEEKPSLEDFFIRATAREDRATDKEREES